MVLLSHMSLCCRVVMPMGELCCIEGQVLHTKSASLPIACWNVRLVYAYIRYLRRISRQRDLLLRVICVYLYRLILRTIKLF